MENPMISGNPLIRVGPRACRFDAVLGMYPGAEGKGCWVVIEGQLPVSLAWSVAEALEAWNGNFNDHGEYDTPSQVCAFQTHTDEYKAKMKEVWG